MPIDAHPLHLAQRLSTFFRKSTPTESDVEDMVGSRGPTPISDDTSKNVNV